MASSGKICSVSVAILLLFKYKEKEEMWDLLKSLCVISGTHKNSSNFQRLKMAKEKKGRKIHFRFQRLPFTTMAKDSHREFDE